MSGWDEHAAEEVDVAAVQPAGASELRGEVASSEAANRVDSGESLTQMTESRSPSQAGRFDDCSGRQGSRHPNVTCQVCANTDRTDRTSDRTWTPQHVCSPLCNLLRFSKGLTLNVTFEVNH